MHCATSRRVPGSEGPGIGGSRDRRVPGSEGPGIGGSRDRYPVTGDFFSGPSDSSMCPGVDSASKNEYQDIPGVKDGRCVMVTTLPPSCVECLEILEP
jgi:hypothetical protein